MPKRTTNIVKKSINDEIEDSFSKDLAVKVKIKDSRHKKTMSGTLPKNIETVMPIKLSNLQTALEQEPKIIQIIKGDSTNAGLFKTPFIDLTVTSPPYNVDMPYNSNDDGLSYKEYLEFTKRWLANTYQWTKPTGRICLNVPLDKNKGGQQSVGADITIIAKEVGWQYHSTVIWNEQNISRRTAWGSWLSASAPYVIAPVELIIIMYKDKWKKSYKGTSDVTRDEFMAWTNGVWTFNGESAKRIGHPAPFPKELPYRCMRLFSYIGDHIFDPFLGSGTTGVIAQRLNRNFTGVELDADYFELAQKRIDNSKTML